MLTKLGRRGRSKPRAHLLVLDFCFITPVSSFEPCLAQDGGHEVDDVVLQLFGSDHPPERVEVVILRIADIWSIATHEHTWVDDNPVSYTHLTLPTTPYV